MGGTLGGGNVSMQVLTDAVGAKKANYVRLQNNMSSEGIRIHMEFFSD